MYNENTLVSIILPVYNGEIYLSEAITSVLNQTYKNFELIIVNDCSTDLTIEIANSFAKIDDRVKVFSNKENINLPATLNVGHRIADGDYITWTSDDNILKINFLERLLFSIRNENVDVVYSNYDIIYDNGTLKRVHKVGPTEHILFGNKIGASFLYKKEVFETLKGYDGSLFLLEDYDFWLRSSSLFKFYHINENLYKYRIHKKSLTFDIYDDNKTKEQHKNKVKEVFEKITNELSWSQETNFFLSSNFNGELIDFDNYFQNKDLIINDFKNFNAKYIDTRKVKTGLLLNLRHHLMSNRDNYNFKLLIQILIHEPLLLFHKSFSIKVSLNYILKSLKFGVK